MEWTVEGLQRAGFDGFVRLSDLGDSAPEAGGVYIVVRSSERPPEFVETSPAGTFHGKNPTVSMARLKAEWVDAAVVVYVGKATRTRPSRGLRKRLTEFERHGAGEPVGHWGGRFIWQLADADDLLVAWKVCDDPTAEESALLAAFHDRYGRLPYANLRR